MLTYIYFVKCPDCEDEHFDFFSDAKDFALSCLSKKPVITQTEVDRNDFGECVDSCDLGTVWSWEDVMTDDEPAKSIFTKDDLKQCACDGSCCDNCKCGHTHEDPEFAALDNSLEVDVRKPVPADMTIDDLVEAMEENEDDVECKMCNELFDKSECEYDADYGWLCSRCQRAVTDHGGQLVIGDEPLDEFYERDPFDHHDPDYDEDEAADVMADMTDRAKDARYDDALDSLDESVDPSDLVELEYPELTVTLYGPKRAEDDWDEVEHTDSHVFLVPKVDVATAIWENWLTEEDVADVEGGLDTLEDDIAWEKFLETHFDDLFEKYNKQILEYFKEEATEDFRERSQEEYQMDQLSAAQDRAYDEWRDEKYFGESCNKQKPFLEEFDDTETRKANLIDCPECGSVSYDMKEQYCSNCGLGL